MFGFIKGVFVQAAAIALASAFVVACSDGDKTAGGTTEDAGIIADLNVAGLTQKGPFAKGSAVTVQGVDCQTMELTGEKFTGSVKSDKGDFGVEDVNLSATCALFEVTGYYFNELTGKKSSEKLTLHALTDLKDRKNVNINVLTELEYERLMFLVTEKSKKFAEAKAQAEKEVLAAFDIKGDFVEFENLNIFESGDENAALLAVSVMMQAETDDAGLVTRMEKFVESFAETGKWKDSTTKNAISEWAIEATANGGLDSIRKNVEAWDLGDTVPAFEKFIEAYADGDSVVLIVTPKSSSSKNGDAGTSAGMTSSSSSQDTTYNAEKNTLTDTRDGQVYRTVTIGDQVWMAENLNYETDSSLCYNDSVEYCAADGRLYMWADANSVCPEGWHLPTTDEFETLFAAVGGDSVAGAKLKSASGWENDGNGTDDFGFTALPAGIRDGKSGLFYAEGRYAEFWGADYNGDYAYLISMYHNTANAFLYVKDFTVNGLPDAASVRCLKGDSAVPPSSSSSKPVETSSSSGNSSSSQFKREQCNVDTDENCFKDERDGQTYKTVTIGTQTWMAENLNLETESSSCYNDYAEKCEKNGRLYTWGAAMDSAGVWSTDGKGCGSHEEYGTVCSATFPVRGVCPEGWHLPDTTEWNVLFDAIGEQLFAGRFWSSVEHNTGYNTEAYGMRSYSEFFPEGLFSNKKRIELSVRCLKNDDGTAPKSSSGVTPQSSDSETSVSSSSSVALATPCKTETEDNCDYGTLTDSRDGQVYKTVKIGDQVWMAENLNFAYTSVPYKYEDNVSDSTSWCYDNDPANCTNYGRLYTWAVAMDSVGAWSEKSKGCGDEKNCSPTYPVQGICPGGWHIPTVAEWKELFVNVGGTCNDEEYSCTNSGAILKSSSGWYDSGNGSDDFGFSVIPSGWYKVNSSDNISLGNIAYFWTAMEYDSSRAYVWFFIFSQSNAKQDASKKMSGHSVRCLKD